MPRGRGGPKKKVSSLMIHPMVSKESIRSNVGDETNKGNEEKMDDDGEEEVKSQILEEEPVKEETTKVDEVPKKKFWVENYVPKPESYDVNITWLHVLVKLICVKIAN